MLFTRLSALEYGVLGGKVAHLLLENMNISARPKLTSKKK